MKPVILLPAGIDAYLTARQLAAVLAHEVCHVRRRDNLTADVHMLVEAPFWFHPLVWWIGARLIAEREQACDEHVVAETAEHFALKWTPEPGSGGLTTPFGLPPGAPPAPADSDAPNLFTAVQEQLGLKLESARAPVEVVVIDHLEKPTPD